MLEGGCPAGDELSFVIGSGGNVRKVIFERILVRSGGRFINTFSDVEYDAGKAFGIDIYFLMIWNLANIACGGVSFC